MGAERIELPSSALEADILPVYYAPLIFLEIVDFYFFLHKSFIIDYNNL